LFGLRLKFPGHDLLEKFARFILRLNVQFFFQNGAALFKLFDCLLTISAERE